MSYTQAVEVFCILFIYATLYWYGYYFVGFVVKLFKETSDQKEKIKQHILWLKMLCVSLFLSLKRKEKKNSLNLDDMDYIANLKDRVKKIERGHGEIGQEQWEKILQIREMVNIHLPYWIERKNRIFLTIEELTKSRAHLRNIRKISKKPAEILENSLRQNNNRRRRLQRELYKLEVKIRDADVVITHLETELLVAGIYADANPASDEASPELFDIAGEYVERRRQSLLDINEEYSCEAEELSEECEEIA